MEGPRPCQTRSGQDHPTFFIPLVLGPLNSLVWYVPSLRYTRGLGWRMHCGAEVTESSTNKSSIDMYNNDVGKGVVYAYEAYEAK